MQLKIKEGNLTDNSDMPNILIQKCNNISNKGGLFPADKFFIIENMSIWAWYILKGSSPPMELFDI